MRSAACAVLCGAALLLLCFHAEMLVATAADDGFDLLFTSNLQEFTDSPLRFTPSLPNWLTGTFVRNGLGFFERGNRTVIHAFDGFAKLASWRFQGNGTAFFSTRFLRTEFYNETQNSNSIAPFMLFDGVQPPFSYLEKLYALYRGFDNMNTHVVRWPRTGGGNDYLAISDYWKVYQFYPRTLSTGPAVTPPVSGRVGVEGYSGVFLNLMSSAHPLPEPGTNNSLTFLSSIGLWENRISLVRVVSTTQRQVIASWNVSKLAYMHSFSVTRKYALLLAAPLYVNTDCMVLRLTPFDCLEWQGSKPSTLYVVDLRTGTVTTLLMDTIFVMHHINAYDLSIDGQMVLDVSAYPNISFVGGLFLSILRDPVRRNQFPTQATVMRFRVDRVARTVSRVPLATPTPPFVNSLDMPSINENFRSRTYCFVYGLVLKSDGLAISKIAVVKRDVCGQSRDRFWQVPGQLPVEPVFVPQPNTSPEDAGLLLVPMVNGTARQSYMAVLDARDMSLVSASALPTVMPFSLHGRFFQEVV